MIVNTRHISVTIWSPVVRDTIIPFDLESTPLQIKTNSTAGSGENFRVTTLTASESSVGGLQVAFRSQVEYKMNYCVGSFTNLQAQPPDEVDKVWTISKTDTALIIECNGAEVLNYQFSSSSDTDCVSKWGGDVEKIKFIKTDTASDSYRAKPTGNGRVEITKVVLP